MIWTVCIPGLYTSILFSSNRPRYKNDALNLVLAGESIAQTESVKYLGLYLDPHLNFDVHVKSVTGKINVRTKLLWTARSFITVELALTLYRSLIEPHLLYCSFILEGATRSNINKLQVQQNCALRVVKCVDCYYPTVMLYSELNVDTINELIMKSTCKFAYKCFYNSCPSVLNNMLTCT